jgi:tRNA G37 N-methylase TrmD
MRGQYRDRLDNNRNSAALLEVEGQQVSHQLASSFGDNECVAVINDEYAGYDGRLKNIVFERRQ